MKLATQYILAISLLLVCLHAYTAVIGNRALAVEGKDTEELCASLVFFMPDKAKGFRLLDATGNECPISLLDKCGGRHEAFFNARPGQKFTLEYLDEAYTPQKAIQKSGLIHLYKGYNGATVQNVAQFKELWKNAQGTRACWEENVFLGGCKLGRPRNTLNIYRGILLIDKPGKYTFHTASTDASFLLIDGKCIAEYPGKHDVWPARTGEYKGDVELSAGRHVFEYLHANSRDGYYAVAAYSRPGDKKMTIVPKEMFLPLRNVKAGQLKAPEGQPIKEVTWKQTGIMDIDWQQLQELTLSNGDTLYFFKPGSLQLEGYTIETRYQFAPPAMHDDKCRKMLLNALRQDETRPISEKEWDFLAKAVVILKNEKLLAAFQERLFSGKAQLSKEAMFRNYKKVLLEDKIQAERYEEIEKELASMQSEDEDCADLELAKLRFYCLGLLDKAIYDFERLNPDRLSQQTRKEYYLLEADLTLFTKGYDEALQRYKLINILFKIQQDKLSAEGELLGFRNALLSKRYQDALFYLDRAEEKRPEIRLMPEIMWMKAQLETSLGRPRLAAWYARAVLKMQPSPATSAGAMLFLGSFLSQHGKIDEAIPLLRQVIDKYPKSQEAISAETLLTKLGKSIP
ncbi:MAG: tetratricopeptide repeat protein [Victivallales bacterium]|nr:tetratricopeptide repeat protein [Victivallales bacterium]